MIEVNAAKPQPLTVQMGQRLLQHARAAGYDIDNVKWVMGLEQEFAIENMMVNVVAIGNPSHVIRKSAPKTFMGREVEVHSDAPKDEIHLVSAEGMIIGRIYNLAVLGA